MANLTGAISQPDSTVALRAISKDARAATFRVIFATGFQQTTCSIDHLPPGERFGPIGSIFLDNTANIQPLTITFLDTGAADIVPPGASSWMLAITGGTRFQLSSPCAAPTPITVQALNVVVPPTGVQAVSGVTLTVATVVDIGNPVQLAAGTADAGTVHVGAGAADIGTVHLAGGAADIGTVHRPPVTFSGALGIPATCGIGSTLIVAAGLATRNLTIQTGPTAAGNLWLNPTGGIAVVGSGVFAAAGGGDFTFPDGVTGDVNGISDNGTIPISGIGS